MDRLGKGVVRHVAVVANTSFYNAIATAIFKNRNNTMEPVHRFAQVKGDFIGQDHIDITREVPDIALYCSTASFRQSTQASNCLDNQDRW